MSDEFESHQKGLISPVDVFVTATADDDEALPFKPRAIFKKTSGIVILEDKDGNIETFADVELVAGVWHAFRPVKVRATNPNVSPADQATATVLIGQ